MKIKSVLVVVNPAKNHADTTAKILKQALDREKVQQKWVEALPYRPGWHRSLNDLKNCKADLALVCGGDGTLLQTAHRLCGSGVPLLGINIGYLGFITSIPGNKVRQGIKRILRGDFVISQRAALEVQVQCGRKKYNGWALNDVLISRGDNPHLVSVSCKVGDHQLTRYRCDGLLVATPTGSTAYSLAAGGPIVSPECEVLVISPICPQALTSRSVVVGGRQNIEVRVDPGAAVGVVQVDGMTLCRMEPEHFLEIRMSEHHVPIAFLPEVDFYDTLAQKLHWHGEGISMPKYYKP